MSNKFSARELLSGVSEVIEPFEEAAKRLYILQALFGTKAFDENRKEPTNSVEFASTSMRESITSDLDEAVNLAVKLDKILSRLSASGITLLIAETKMSQDDLNDLLKDIDFYA